MGGELVRAGLLPACFRGTLLCLFLLLFVFSSCPFFKTVYFFLFSLLLSRDRTWFYNPAGTSYAALMPKQVLTLNTAFFSPFPAPTLSILLPAWPAGKGLSMEASSA